MNFQFTPDNTQPVSVPYFEDARADFAPYYRNEDTIEDAKQNVIHEFAKLQAVNVQFQQGTFRVANEKRLGFRIEFNYCGVQGVMHVAALPFRGRTTPVKTRTALAQALLNVRDWLKAAVTMKVFAPTSEPLIPYMLVDGTRTVADYLHENRYLPPQDKSELLLVEKL